MAGNFLLLLGHIKHHNIKPFIFFHMNDEVSNCTVAALHYVEVVLDYEQAVNGGANR